MRAQPPEQVSLATEIEEVRAIPQVPRLLDVCARATGMRFVAISHVTDSRWVACATLDHIGLDVGSGATLDLGQTICDGIDDPADAVVIDDIERDPAWRGHPASCRFGFRSFISVPIVLPDGSIFGTVCAMDTEPRELAAGPFVPMFSLFADLVASEIASGRRQRESETALHRAVESVRLREEFIGVIGHDLRNPVSALSAGLRMLARADDDRRKTIIAEMHKSVLRMSALIQNLMDFTRGRLGGRIELELQPSIDLAGMLADLAQEIETGMSREIVTDIDISRPVQCDAGRIGQLVSNLLANATTHGAPDAPVRLNAHARNGHLQIEVANSGQPIPESRLGTLFEPYSRGGDTSPSQGLGLGLHIASRIAEAHGGRLTARSTPAETAFTFEMPLANQNA